MKKQTASPKATGSSNPLSRKASCKSSCNNPLKGIEVRDYTNNPPKGDRSEGFPIKIPILIDFPIFLLNTI